MTGRLIFIGLGLNPEGLTLEGLREAKAADRVYVELYTSIVPGLTAERLEEILGREVEVLERKDVEEGYTRILEEASKADVVLLVPGDPFVATTHIALRIEACKRSIPTRVVNSASIVSAVAGATGLQIYRFGQPVTLTYPDSNVLPLTVYRVVKENTGRGLHTLILLDLRIEEGRWMSVAEAVDLLEDMERRVKGGVFNGNRLAIGLARVGNVDAKVKAGRLSDLRSYCFGGPPHSLVLPGELHFMEVEALVWLAQAPVELLKRV